MTFPSLRPVPAERTAGAGSFAAPERGVRPSPLLWDNLKGRAAALGTWTFAYRSL